MDDLQKSEILIAKILDTLMQKGIQEWHLSFDLLALGEEYEPFYYPCVDWLVEEGVIRVGSINRTLGGYASGSIRNPALTSFGMQILGHDLKIGDENQRVSEVVRKISSEGRSFSQAGDFFGGLLGGFTKSIGS